MAKLSKNEYILMEVLVRICKAFDCMLNNVVKIKKEQNDARKEEDCNQ